MRGRLPLGLGRLPVPVLVSERAQRGVWYQVDQQREVERRLDCGLITQHVSAGVGLEGGTVGATRAWFVTIPADRHTLTLVEPEEMRNGLPSPFIHRTLSFTVAAPGTEFGDTLFPGYARTCGSSRYNIAAP